MKAVRTLVVHCVDWSITAAGFSPEDPVAIVQANQIVACSVTARGAGVSVGTRRREAQRRCPDLQVLEHDSARDARTFEPVVAAIEDLAPTVEVFRPGICMLSTRGPSRYFGGDIALTAKVLDSVERVMKELGAVCQVGIADSPFAARLAAQHSTIVPVGETVQFLEPLSVAVLDRPELASLLSRLGIRTLGRFAALSEKDVTARFGPDGTTAHRLARGLDEHRIKPRTAPKDLTVSIELDPPADRVDAAAFAGRTLAVQLLNDLGSRSLTCTRITIEAETEHGEMLRRSWRFDGVCTERSLSERVRWQLDGWLSGAVGTERPSGGVLVLRLVPDEIRPDNGVQRNFWNVSTANDERAAHGFTRIQGLLGPESVQLATIRGGRHPADRTQLTAWGENPEVKEEPLPWPNQVPSPSPTIVKLRQEPIEVLDAEGEVVTVSRRGVVSERPMLLRAAGSDERIVAWAGPWTSDDQWWDSTRRKRRAFMQIVTESGTAHLVAASGRQWLLDATYD